MDERLLSSGFDNQIKRKKILLKFAIQKALRIIFY